MFQRETPKTLQQITGLVINSYQKNQNFASGKKSTWLATKLNPNFKLHNIISVLIK